MIGALRGTVAAVGEDAVLIDVSGVGYVAHCGARTLARLAVSDSIQLWVETVVREDMLRLYGFATEEERAWFVHLQTVPSVGARVALNILDAMSPGEIADAVALQDKAGFTRANGVGPKLGARIAQELAGKAPPRTFGALIPNSTEAARTPPSGGGGSRQDALSALVNLGIDQATASRAVAAAMKKADGTLDAPSLIRSALKEVQG